MMRSNLFLSFSLVTTVDSGNDGALVSVRTQIKRRVRPNGRLQSIIAARVFPDHFILRKMLN